MLVSRPKAVKIAVWDTLIVIDLAHVADHPGSVTSQPLAIDNGENYPKMFKLPHINRNSRCVILRKSMSL